MIDNGYLYATDNKRLFINVSLGCNGGCTYCYLPKINYSNKKILTDVKSSEEILRMIKESNVDINKNTLITIGCFSESFDYYNKEETIDLINYFLKKGNQVQISTKKEIGFNDINKIIPNIKYYGQFIVFVSMATISMHDLIEKNTDKPQMRLNNFKYNNYFPVILYIKPFLKNITDKDTNLFKETIKENNIKYVVVGSIFSEEISNEMVPFSNDGRLHYHEVEGEQDFVNVLEKDCFVAKRSTEITRLFKKEKKIIKSWNNKWRY